MDKPKFEVLAYEPTELGLLCLRCRELLCEPGTFVTEVTLDHEFLMSSYLTASERSLSEIALSMHAGSQLSVLVGGLGLGYTAHAALASDRVATCEVIEYLSQVIDWMKTGLVPLSDELNNAPRFSVVQDDVYKRLGRSPSKTNPKKYDLILIDVDHSPDDNLGAANADFYTTTGLLAAKQHLAPGGVLGVWSYAESSPFADALREVFDEVRLEPITVLNHLIDVEQTDWLFFAKDRS